MIEIKNLHASIQDKEILKGINLKVNAGEVHAIMGPNGSGKSTLCAVLSGNSNYTITQGEVLFNGKNLLELSIEERAREGLFVAFQYPVEIPGVSNMQFLRASLNAIKTHHNKPELTAKEFLEHVKAKQQLIEIDSTLTNRNLNEGFSGGEKKKNEIFQMAVLEPQLAILDETDSGLDIDALKIVSHGVNKLKSKNNAVILITHYQRLLEYIVPDFVHVLYNGQIVKQGDKSLALELENSGYDNIKASVK